jgi:competence protein ComEC
VGLFPSLAPRDPQRLKCTFLAVDHGLAVVLRLPGGATMLYDAGLFTSPEAGAEVIAGYLWSQGITRVDAIVLSHPDADHFNAVPGLLDRLSVGGVYVSPMMFKEKGAAVDFLGDSLRRAGVPVREIWAGDRLCGGDGCCMEVLHPPRRGVFGSDNANSLVLAIEYQGKKLLLTGDLDSPGLEDVVAEEPWPCDVLLVPHHGSLRSNAPALAAWASPKWAVVSGGHRANVSRTAAAYRDAGAQILHTAQTGAIDFEINSTGLNVATFRQGAVSEEGLSAR